MLTHHFSHLTEEPEEYFLYLGRITEDKGVHLAIEAAKAAGVKLRIAGVSHGSEGSGKNILSLILTVIL